MFNDMSTGRKSNPPDPGPPKERMLIHFSYDHLPDHLKQVSQPFYFLACTIVQLVEPGPERTVAMRKLLESKDAAVRAKAHPFC